MGAGELLMGKKFVFFSSTDFGAYLLEKLCKRGLKENMVGVVCPPDMTVKKRGKEIQVPNPVKDIAIQEGLRILQPEEPGDDDFVETLREIKPDLQIVVAYKILPTKVWSLPRWGTINVHPSWLPNFRGAAPIPWTIASGEQFTKVTVFSVREKVDQGSILCYSPPVWIIGQDGIPFTGQEVLEILKPIALESLISAIIMMGNSDGNPPMYAQDPKHASYAPKLTLQNTEIDMLWTAKKIRDHIQGMSYQDKSAWLMLNDGYLLKIIRAAEIGRIRPDPEKGEAVGDLVMRRLNGMNSVFLLCNGKEAVRILEVQAGGKKVMNATDWYNGYKNKK